MLEVYVFFLYFLLPLCAILGPLIRVGILPLPPKLVNHIHGHSTIRLQLLYEPVQFLVKLFQIRIDPIISLEPGKFLKVNCDPFPTGSVRVLDTHKWPRESTIPLVQPWRCKWKAELLCV